MKDYRVKDPWPSRLRALLNRAIICPIVGHDTIEKMDGTKLCRRH